VASHKSALKRAHQSEIRRLRNKAVKTKVKSAVKAVRQALEAGQKDEAAKALSQAVPIIGKAAGKGILHPRNASRKISRLSQQVHRLQKA